jgi:multidrug transporter EmrE-like cation transporter
MPRHSLVLVPSHAHVAGARGMNQKVLGNLVALVTAEVIAFALLEQSLKSPKQDGPLTAAAVCILLVVPFCFKNMLKSGESIAVANLYWIVLSLVLGALLSTAVFKQPIARLQFVGMGIAVAGAVVAYVGGQNAAAVEAPAPRVHR